MPSLYRLIHWIKLQGKKKKKRRHLVKITHPQRRRKPSPRSRRSIHLSLPSEFSEKIKKIKTPKFALNKKMEKERTWFLVEKTDDLDGSNPLSSSAILSLISWISSGLENESMTKYPVRKKKRFSFPGGFQEIERRVVFFWDVEVRLVTLGVEEVELVGAESSSDSHRSVEFFNWWGRRKDLV